MSSWKRTKTSKILPRLSFCAKLGVMSKLISFLTLFSFTTVLWLIFFTKPAYAITCSFELNPLQPNTLMNHLTVTITNPTGDLATANNYAVWLRETARPTNTNYVKNNQTFNGTPMVITFQKNTDGWKPGEYKIEVHPHPSGSALERTPTLCSSSPIRIIEVPQQDCTLTLANSRQPVQINEDVIVGIRGALTTSNPHGPWGGYRVYIDKAQSFILPYNGASQFTVHKERLSTSPVGQHTIELRTQCALSPSCREDLQCAPLTFSIAPHTNPTCSVTPAVTPTTPQTNNRITIIGNNLPEGNELYTIKVYQMPPPRVAGSGTLIVPAGSGARTDSNGHISLTTSTTLSEGDYTIDIVKNPVRGDDQVICSIPIFHVYPFTPPPEGTVTCSIAQQPATETDDVRFEATGLDPNVSYIPIVDGSDKTAVSSDDSGTLHTALGTFTKDAAHRVNVRNLNDPDDPNQMLCTNGDSTFQTTAVGTPSSAGACNDSTCSSAAGQPCNTRTGEPIYGNVAGDGIMTAIGCVPTEPQALIQGLMKVGTGAAGAVALLLMIGGAFQMITSAGNAETLKKGQQQFTSAIIGLLFIIFSILLLQVIGVDILNLPGFNR